MSAESSLKRAATLLRDSASLTVLTGAGISVDSGLGTYRTGATPLWTAESMAKYANPGGFRRHIDEAWPWYDARRRAMLEAEPNAGHRLIAALERRIAAITVITQNIDSLHQRAGSSTVVEIHGSLARSRCFECGTPHEWPGADELVQRPRCGCGGLLRPDVVMFEELLDEGRMELATRRTWDADLFMAIGTSGTVYPAAALTENRVLGGGAAIIVNPSMAGQPGGAGAVWLEGGASDVLARLVVEAWPDAP